MGQHINSFEQISDQAKFGLSMGYFVTRGGEQVVAILDYKIHRFFLANKQLLHTNNLVNSHTSANALYFFLSFQQAATVHVTTYICYNL
jgi:hypothetical protein